MKFDCGPTWAEKRERLKNWHPFFAIWPRRVGSRDCRCFEWIERKGTFSLVRMHSFWRWEYRAKQPDAPAR